MKTKKHNQTTARTKKRQTLLKQGKVKVIRLKPLAKWSDKATGTSQIDAMEGRFFELKDYPLVIRSSCDIYGIQPDGSEKLLAKYRRSVLPAAACEAAYHALYKVAQLWTDNRGAAAGMLNLRNVPKHVGSIVKRDKFRVFYKSADGKVKKTNPGNEVRSNIIGYYDRPDRNALRDGAKMKGPPCRLTAFTRDEVEKWQTCQPLIQAVDRQFARLVPDRHRIQLARCRLTPRFQIGDTAFSTITVNYNYRTALHKDAGDLEEGFGNLVVLEKSKIKRRADEAEPAYEYNGGYLGFPRYGVCIDVRHGDFLAMDVHEWHSNTKMQCTCPAGPECKNDDHFGRLSLVFYLRKKMANCAKHKPHD